MSEKDCCCGGHDNCGDSHDHHSHEHDENVTTVLFGMDNDFMKEINEAAEASGMDFQDFVLNSIEIALEVVKGNLAILDPESGTVIQGAADPQPDEDADEEE